MVIVFGLILFSALALIGEAIAQMTGMISPKAAPPSIEAQLSRRAHAPAVSKHSAPVRSLP